MYLEEPNNKESEDSKQTAAVNQFNAAARQKGSGRKGGKKSESFSIFKAAERSRQLKDQ